MESNELTIQKLLAEHDRLNRKILFLERENRALRKEVEEAQKREVGLLDEITRLEALAEARQEPSVRHVSAPVRPAASLEDFLYPKVSARDEDPFTTGIEANWEDLMVAFTDAIFIEANTPDLVLYRDEERRGFVSPSGKTLLRSPIRQEDLDAYNILYVRRATPEEQAKIVRDYGLE